MTAYLSQFSAWCVVGVRGPAAEASTYKVWRVAPSARVRRSALLLLRFSFRGVLSPLSAALVTSSVARLTLVTLVVLLIVSPTGRAPPSWVAPVTVPVGSVLTSLDRYASWASDICCLCSLRTQKHVPRLFIMEDKNSEFIFRNYKTAHQLEIKETLTFSPSTTSNSTVSPSPTLRRYFLGLFFFMAV